MDAMAGNTPLFTYVLSSDYMGAAQEIARSLVSGVEAAQQEQLERQLQRKTRRSAKGKDWQIFICVQFVTRFYSDDIRIYRKFAL